MIELMKTNFISNSKLKEKKIKDLNIIISVFEEQFFAFQRLVLSFK
jgi:hypothetical protein